MDDGATLPLEEARAIFAAMADYPFYKLYVVERDGCVLATYALLVMRNIAHLGARSAIVEQVMVDPGAQGQGLGRLMMAHAVETARAQGCYKLALSSNLKRAAAHAFYDSFGFERHGYSFKVML
jgi:GNAT superfamily N-acetyltransferase